MFKALLLASTIGLASAAHATVTYSYVGNGFDRIGNTVTTGPDVYTSGNHVTLTFTTAEPLVNSTSHDYSIIGIYKSQQTPSLLSWNISDGTQTFTNPQQYPYQYFDVVFGPTGVIDSWFVKWWCVACTSPEYVGTAFNANGQTYDEGGNVTSNYALNQNNPGTWSIVNDAPYCTDHGNCKDNGMHVPEPSTWLILLLALGSTAGFRWVNGG